MPTFFTDDPAADGDKRRRVPLIAPNSGPAADYRPRRREGGRRHDDNEGFAPPAIPPEVKEQINARISEMVRNSRGPDETMWRISEFFSGVGRAASALAARITGRHDDDEFDDEEDMGFEDESGDAESDEDGEPGNRRKQPGKEHGDSQGDADRSRSGRRRGRRGRGKPGDAGHPQEGKAQANGGRDENANDDSASHGDGGESQRGGNRNRRRRGRRGRRGGQGGGKPEGQGGEAGQ